MVHEVEKAVLPPKICDYYHFENELDRSNSSAD